MFKDDEETVYSGMREAQMTVEITPEMEWDFYDCWDKAEHTQSGKDCSTCSWNGQNITCGTSACEIVPNGAAGKGESYETFNRNR